jgi:AraC-like DNA-binding protein
MTSSLLSYSETGARIAPQSIASAVGSAIEAEQQWRSARAPHAQSQRPQGHVPVSRRTCNITTPLEVVNHSHKSDHCIGLTLKCVTLTFNHAGRRLMLAHQFTASNAQNREGAALPQWRMNRVIEYVDAHLSETIGLADIAASGLTRMHFAAQFRRATGLRPHEYLLRRRIEHAQHLLLISKHSVFDVALSCGFRSQAHFTTVFKRFVGETPYSWRMKANGVR